MTNIYNPKEIGVGVSSAYELKDVYISSFHLLGRPDTSRPLTPGWNVRSEPGAV